MAMRLWRDYGCSVIPVSINKRPLWDLLPQVPKDEADPSGGTKGTWKPYQAQRPDDAEMSRWMKADPPAFAIVTGAISGRITFDFDGSEGVELVKKWGVR